MSRVLITGPCGLVGSEAALFFAGKGWDIVGIDNDLRAFFFGPSASTQRMKQHLQQKCPSYAHHSIDIRDYPRLEEILSTRRSVNV